VGMLSLETRVEHAGGLKKLQTDLKVIWNKMLYFILKNLE
jgi:hypothetical protein